MVRHKIREESLKTLFTQPYNPIQSPIMENTWVKVRMLIIDQVFTPTWSWAEDELAW